MRKALVIRLDDKASKFGITAFSAEFNVSGQYQIVSYLKSLASNDPETIGAYAIYIDDVLVFASY